MCRVLNVSRSGFYGWLRAVPSARTITNLKLIEEIKKVHQESKLTYGSPRVTKELKNRKIYVSRPRVARLMRKAHIKSVVKRKFKITTLSDHNYRIDENKLNRNFTVTATGKVWVSDISYIKTAQGWLYLTIIMDLADRRIVGWSLSSSLKVRDTVTPAWIMAVRNRPIISALLFHSDRGIHYACDEFKNLLKQYPLVETSMSRKGNCWDNAVAESFFKTLKTEWVYQQKYLTLKQAAVSIFQYIEAWYNTKRIHSALGYRSPKQFEEYLNNNLLAA
jgi:transposase InsO family protein